MEEEVMTESTVVETKIEKKAVSKAPLKDRALFALAYLPIGLVNYLAFCTLFFIPLLFAGDKEKAKGYANEGLVISLFVIAWNLIWGLFTYFVDVSLTADYIIQLIVRLGVLFFVLFGMINALNDKQVNILGGIKIIK